MMYCNRISLVLWANRGGNGLILDLIELPAWVHHYWALAFLRKKDPIFNKHWIVGVKSTYRTNFFPKGSKVRF